MLRARTEYISISTTPITGTATKNYWIFYLYNTGTDLIISSQYIAKNDHYVIAANTYYIISGDAAEITNFEAPWVFYEYETETHPIPTTTTRTIYCPLNANQITIENLNVKAFYTV